MLELVKQSLATKFANDPIVSIGSYYDKHTYIDVLAIRKSGKMLAGACKYSKEAAKINMFNSLKEKCQKVELDIEEYVLFSKNGFSSELEQLDNENITLLSHDNLATLLDDLSKDDLLVYTNKKY